MKSAIPDREEFPNWDDNLRQAFRRETELFFQSIVREDRSVIDLLDADYTYLNEELAKYYGVPDVTGKEFRRVALKPEYHRGGLLGMGSILSLTSHTSRTSPTLRGKWILEALFGAAPPPPPANVSTIKEEAEPGKQPKSFREKLAMHASQASCATCHRKMDPLGYALDNFDGIGQWRDRDGNKPLDTSGVLPGGSDGSTMSRVQSM